MKKKIYISSPPMIREDSLHARVWDVLEGQSIPLGTYYLASFLRENGYEVAVADAAAFKMTEEDLLNEIASFSPAFVGISSTTMCFDRAVSVAGRIKKEFPQMVTIIGGSHATADMEGTLACRDFDFAVIGEGEITALELLDALSQNNPVSGIKGLAFRDEAGQLVFTGPRPLIKELDMLPFPAVDLIPDRDVYKPALFEHRSWPAINMITSRGCPGRCTFCASTVMGKKYRARSAQNVFEEIKHLKQTYGIRDIYFSDDNFLLDKQRIYSLFELLRAEGLSFNWMCLARINSVDYEFLRFLKDNGCWCIMFGIESGDPEILRKIKKGLSLKKTARVVGWYHELGIMTRGFFIIGHPLETLESIARTMDYALKIPLDSMACAINTPYPGTRQFEEAETYGTFDRSNWSRFTGFYPVFVPLGLSREILLEKQHEMINKFYSRPHIIFNIIKRFMGRGEIRRLERMKALASIILIRLRIGFFRASRGAK